MSIDPISLAMIGAPIATDLLSQWLSKADREEQRRLEQEAMAVYGDASPPTLERMLKEKLGPSAMEGISLNTPNKSARDAAIQSFLQIGNMGGMDPGSQLAVEQARRGSAQEASRNQQAVFQQAQQRGLGGAGVVGLQLQAGQAAADRQALSDMQAAGDARSRALQALAQGGGMAGQAVGQDFDQQERIARSRDAIARFNSELATNALQQNWQNDLALRDRRYNSLMGGSQRAGERAGLTSQHVGNYGQGVVGAVGSMFGPYGGGRQPTAAEEVAHVKLSPAEPLDYDINDPRRRTPR